MNYLTIIFTFIFASNHLSEDQLSKSTNFSDCGLNHKARNFAQLVMDSTDQHRSKLQCNKKLAEIALEKAKMMSKANDINHNIEHTTPNQLLRSGNIQLPKIYPILGNQVEAVMGGVSTAQESFDIFMTSPDHKAHLLGEGDFLQDQDQIGVAYFYDKDTQYEHYWVIYITRVVQED
jgi:uncharacterized protein YkwD